VAEPANHSQQVHKLMLSSLVPSPPHPVFVACSTTSTRTGRGCLGRC